MTASKKLIQAAAGSAGGGDFYPYTIDNSARFNDDDSAYLYRTPSSVTNRIKWTYSVWVKRANLSSGAHVFLSAYSPPNEFTYCGFENNSIVFGTYNLISPGWIDFVQSTDVMRDSSAWYHLVWVYDSANATTSDRVKLYVNNKLITSFLSANYPTSSYAGWVNNTVQHSVGSLNFNGSRQGYVDGYLSEVVFIDGQALNPTSFGEDKNGVWVPKNVSGLTFGTNGYYLKFANSGALGTDSSGNGNNFTVSGLTSSDQMLDTPTNNFATFNPLAVSNTTVTLSEGNLKAVCGASGGGNATATMAMPSEGKWYFETTIDALPYSSLAIGFWDYNSAEDYAVQGTGVHYYKTGNKYVDGTSTAYGASFTTSDVIGVAVDISAGTVTFYKNNTSQGAISYAVEGMFPVVSDVTGGGGETATINFGQSAFTYTPPTDHLALCTANLPEPTIGPNSTTTSDENFNTVLWTGDQSARTITGYGFQPDFLWTKCRSTVESHRLHDVVRGGNGTVLYELNSNETSAEGTDTLVSGFAADGFTIAAGGNSPNVSGRTYVGWAWKGNGSGSSNTDGSITSTVSVNTDAGISIVTYTGNGSSNQTVGHGLGVDVGMVIVKRYDSAPYVWRVWHSGLSGDTYYLGLNQTNAESSSSTVFNGHSSTTFTVGNDPSVNGSSGTMVAYVFAEVEGFSKFGKYTGNGSATEGPFIYCGFRPAWILIKSSSLAQSWVLKDTARFTSNVTKGYLLADTSAAEVTDHSPTYIDILSNGFKLRGSANATNASGATYIYIAFAENPFKYANAR